MYIKAVYLTVPLAQYLNESELNAIFIRSFGIFLNLKPSAKPNAPENLW